MAVKIITFHKALNYGAVLQCTALYKALNDLGADAYIYDYVTPKIRNSYKMFKASKSMKNNILQILSLPIKLRKTNRFQAFLNDNVRMSDKAEDDDVFITGSDQVWNWRASDFDKAYFLDFVKDDRKKNSYAASFGLSEIEEKYRPEYAHLLSRFNYISVREERGRELVAELCQKEAVVVPDPVFLCTADTWRRLAEPERKDEGYILLYLMAKTPSAIAFAKTLSQKTGLKVCFIDNYEMKLAREFEIKRGCGPSEWLSLFANCKYVVTNSFHGTAFSLIFNKEVFVELLPESYGVNSRLENILAHYNLLDRIINNRTPDEFTGKTDYIPVNAKINEDREAALTYLKNIMDGCDK